MSAKCSLILSTVTTYQENVEMSGNGPGKFVTGHDSVIAQLKLLSCCFHTLSSRIDENWMNSSCRHKNYRVNTKK